MKHGNISNTTNPYVILDVDGLLFKEVEVPIKIGKIPLPLKRRKRVVDQNFRKLLYALLKKDLNTILISINETDAVKLNKILYDNYMDYYRECICINDLADLRNGRYPYSYFVSENPSLNAMMGTTNVKAGTVAEFKGVLF